MYDGKVSLMITPDAAELPALRTSIVYVKASPGTSAVLLTRFAICTLGLRNCVVAEAVRSAVWSLSSVTLLVTNDALMPLVVPTFTVMLPDAPAASVPMFHTSVPFWPTAGAEVGASEELVYVRPAGRTSVRITPVSAVVLGLA